MLRKVLKSVPVDIHQLKDESISPNAIAQIQSLQEENALLRAVIDNFPGGLMLIDKNLNLIFCNEQQKQLLDYPPHLFAYGNPSLEQLFRFNALRGEYGPGKIEDLVAERMELTKQRSAHVFERKRPNGTVLLIRGVPLSSGGFMTTYLDITARKSVDPLRPDNAEYDQLTGLPKGVILRSRISQMLADSKLGNVSAVHCMDLDHFKDFNEKFGQAGGDHALQTVASRLQQIVRGNDTVARIGGDRFVVLQSDVKKPSDVAKLANRILKAIGKPMVFEGVVMKLTSSIGLALAPRDGTEAITILSKAESAVLRTKVRSRGGFEIETTKW
jgi:diguanylate cyclase (GGDEF)-like protein